MQTYIAILAVLLSAGCASNPTSPKQTNAPPIYHLHLPGIGGETFVHEWWCDEVHRAAPTTQSDVYDWTGHRFPIMVLQAYERNRAEAKKIAEQIATMRREHPAARIVISAESGGAGPAVWALEDLPEDVSVDSVVLLAPALSPEYDLTAALRHVTGSMYVFISEQDNFILAWGTEQYGTIDGKRVQAAGRFGFAQPECARPSNTESWCRFRTAQIGGNTGTLEATPRDVSGVRQARNRTARRPGRVAGIRFTRMHRRVITAFFLLLCWARALVAQPADAPKDTWLLHLPGIGGEMRIDHLFTQGLLTGGVDADLEIYDWTGTDRGMIALMQVKRHQEQSSIVAEMIEKHVRRIRISTSRSPRTAPARGSRCGRWRNFRTM